MRNILNKIFTMKNILIINGHQPYEGFSSGKLNASIIERLKNLLPKEKFTVKESNVMSDYNIDEEIEKHQWADVVFLQFPINWMQTPWMLKKYQDTVYTFGMDGRLCAGDGRSREDASKQYGSAGTLTNTKYMLSITFNAPQNAFNDVSQVFFAGKSVDDLLFPTHLNFKFFGMESLPTFACYDVLKNPDIENDFKRFDAHIKTHLL